MMSTRSPTWKTKGESLEVNANANIETKLTPSIKNTILRVFHVGACNFQRNCISLIVKRERESINYTTHKIPTLTPGARAPTRTACAEDTSSSPDLLSSIFNPVSGGSLGFWRERRESGK